MLPLLLLPVKELRISPPDCSNLFISRNNITDYSASGTQGIYLTTASDLIIERNDILINAENAYGFYLIDLNYCQINDNSLFVKSLWQSS